jgi:hypothetical protein
VYVDTKHTACAPCGHTRLQLLLLRADAWGEAVCQEGADQLPLCGQQLPCALSPQVCEAREAAVGRRQRACGSKRSPWVVSGGMKGC